MLRAGGEAGKLGLRYAEIWTVSQFLSIPSRNAVSIVVEPLQDGELNCVAITTTLSEIRQATLLRTDRGFSLRRALAPGLVHLPTLP